ncbi:hypothetical protein CA696_004265 [Escherichia coli]|nr:hypothetical protein CA696_004265 [Escherichia coli]
MHPSLYGRHIIVNTTKNNEFISTRGVTIIGFNYPIYYPLLRYLISPKKISGIHLFNHIF